MKIETHRPTPREIGVRTALPLFLLLLSLTRLDAQVFEWARMGGGYGMKQGNGVAVDGTGNAIIVGKVIGNGGGTDPGIRFEDGSPPDAQLSSSGAEASFIVMYDATGALRWGTTIEGAVGSPGSQIIATSAAVTENDFTLYITGTMSGTVNFGGTVGPRTAVNGSSFLAKYHYNDQAATIEWVALIEPQSPADAFVQSRAVAVGPQGQPWICGTFMGQVQFLKKDETLGILTTPTPQPSLFVTRYDIEGTPAFVQRGVAGTNGSAYGAAIAVDGNNDAVITGHFTETVAFGSTTLTGPVQSRGSLCVARCLANGTFDWAKSGGGLAAEDSAFGQGVALDAAGNAYVTGRFSGTLTLGSTTYTSPSVDLFVARVPSAGLPSLMARGGVGLTGDASGNGIAVRNGGIWVTGSFSGTITFGTPNYAIAAHGNHDIIVARFDAAAGTLDWARRAGNILTGVDRSHYNRGRGIAVDGSGRAYVMGEFGGAADFFNTQGLDFNHSRNIFLARLSSTATLVTGRVLNDVNGDGTGTSDGGIPNRTVQITNPSLGEDFVTTGANGEYRAWLPADQAPYIVRALPLPYRTMTGPTPPTAYTIIANGGTMIDSNFWFMVNPLDTGTADMAVTMTVLTSEHAEFGRDLCYRIDYENTGTTTITSGTIQLCYDRNLGPLPGSVVSSVSLPNLGPFVSGGSCLPPLAMNIPMQWTLPPATRLQPGQKGSIRVCFSVPGHNPGSPTSLITGVTGTTPGDDDPTNNAAIINQDVVEPSDPNSKQVLPHGDIGVPVVRNGLKMMTYTVQFYNVGAGPADIIHVYDILDGALDVYNASDVTIESYAPVAPVLTVDHLMNGLYELHFVYTGANLTTYNPANGAPIGFVTFSVPLKPDARDVPIGREVNNRACVVFMNSQNEPLDTLCTNPVANCVAMDFTAEKLCINQRAEFKTSGNGSNYLMDGRGRVSWDFGDGSPPTVNEDNPTHPYLAPGTYLVTLTISSDTARWLCDRFDTIFTVRKLVTISPRPQPQITTGDGHLLTSTPAAEYQWYQDGVPIPHARTQSYLATGSHSYTVHVFNTAGCEGQSFEYTTGVDEPARTNAMTVHPNPGSGVFTVNAGEVPRAPWRLTVTDVGGRVVLRRGVDAGATSCTIDLGTEAPGAYTVTVELDGRVLDRKILIQR